MPLKGSLVLVWGEFVIIDGEWGCFKGTLPIDLKGYLNSCPKQDAFRVSAVVVTRGVREHECELLISSEGEGCSEAKGPAVLLLPRPFPNTAGREADVQGQLLDTL